MKSILCFGDSNTYGLIPGAKGRFSFEERWSGRLDLMLRSEEYRIIEEGLCGRTTAFEEDKRKGRSGIEELPILLETHTPIDTVIVMLGTNDCKTQFHASELEIGRGMEQLLMQIRLYAPKARILLMSPIELGEEVWREDKDPDFSKESVQISKKLKSVYMELAKTYGCEFLAASDYAKASREDEEHLDRFGHQRLAAAIYRKLKGVSNYGCHIY